MPDALLQKKILLVGPQGSGKGTQAALLGAYLKLPYFSMGELFRFRAQKGDEVARQIAEIQKRGELAPFDLTMEVLRSRFAEGDCDRGYILDGFPRDYGQFQAYDQVDRPSLVVLLYVPPEVSYERIMARAALEGRADDTPEILARRLAIYEAENEKTLAEYRRRGIVHQVDGVGTREEVFERIVRIFSDVWPS